VDLTNTEEKARFERQRRKKLARIRELGVEPYGGRYDGTEAAVDIKSRFGEGDQTQQAKCAGRIVLLRAMGALIFITLRDWSGTIQVGLSRKLLGAQWKLAKLLELGDAFLASVCASRRRNFTVLQILTCVIDTGMWICGPIPKLWRGSRGAAQSLPQFGIFSRAEAFWKLRPR